MNPVVVTVLGRLEDEIHDARVRAMNDVLRAHGMLGKRFHNEAVMDEVATVVAAGVAAVVATALAGPTPTK